MGARYKTMVKIKNSVTQDQIDELIANARNIKTQKLGDKTCLVHVILKNGFELIESSACVDPANYDAEIGEEICLERIKNKLWELEGYKLQAELYKSNNGR